MNQERTHLIDWLRRRGEILHQQKTEVLDRLLGTGTMRLEPEMADDLFTQSLELEVELCRVTGLRAHLEDGDKSLSYDDKRIGILFDSVQAEESMLIARFEGWKDNGQQLGASDFERWRDAMNVYFRASPGEV